MSSVMLNEGLSPELTPDSQVKASDLFGFDLGSLEVPAFSHPNAYTPLRDESYTFDPDTTRAILADTHNRRVLIRASTELEGPPI